MLQTMNDVMEFVRENDVKFIRLAFCDVYGEQKNISVMAPELGRAFETGVYFDASAIRGFGSEDRSDLLLHPDPGTLALLPWRPAHGRVARLFCDISYPDGTPFELDGRHLLRSAAAELKDRGLACGMGAECEFYLFKTDESGEPTEEPLDRGCYMDVAPADKGENIRREICLTLEEMGIYPESSHHEEGPGQNEIDCRYSSPLASADDVTTFKSVVRAIAARNGLYADFSPRPLSYSPGSGMHVNLSPRRLGDSGMDTKLAGPFLAGIMEHISCITAFLNPTGGSYARLGQLKAPKYITWSHENRSQLVRIPAASGEYSRIELRSPDCCANPYIAWTLLIKAGLDGIERGLTPPAPTDANLYTVPAELTRQLTKLPQSIEEARAIMKASDFVRSALPQRAAEAYL